MPVPAYGVGRARGTPSSEMEPARGRRGPSSEAEPARGKRSPSNGVEPARGGRVPSSEAELARGIFKWAALVGRQGRRGVGPTLCS
jgi:hypothetical protein